MIKDQNKNLLNLVAKAVMSLHGKHPTDNGSQKLKFGLETWLMQSGFQLIKDILQRNFEEKVETFM
jgi:hypothetical protein